MEDNVFTISIDDFSKICRTCLKTGDLRPLSECDNIGNSLEEFNIEFNLSNGLPQNICISCLIELENIFIFMNQIKKNDDVLKKILLNQIQHNSSLIEETNSSNVSENLEATEFDEADSKIMEKSVVHTNVVPKKYRSRNKLDCVCSTCGKKFSRWSGLARHSKIHLGIKPFKCKFCNKTFIEKAYLHRHILIHTGSKPFECSLCGKSTRRKDQIIEHITKHHPNATSPNLVITEHQIPEINSIDTIHETKTELVDSEEIQNNNERKPKTKKRVEICLCNLCGKVFRRRGYLKNHMAIHANIKPYQCKICSKGFTQRHALNRHTLVHTKERPYQCNLCGKTFTRKEILSEHIKNHDGVKPYLCFHCGKCFTNKDYLSKHLKYYLTGNKNKEKVEDNKCVCSYCGKQLHSLSYLKTHLLTHTGEKPYECNMCGKRFTVQRSLNHHLNIHKGIKPYQCTQCDKAFRTSGSLRKHILLHTGERPFRCTSCDKGFIRRSHLKRHFKCH